MAQLPIVAIVGRANVGKSSLFNRILEKKQAIVADVPGTTRDAIYGKVSINGTNFWLVDTAGLKSPDDEFEMTIQEQITQATDAADVIIVVIEHGVGVTDEDRRVAKMALKSKKTVLLAVNKADDPRKTDTEPFNKLGIKDIQLVSAQHNRGISELGEKLAGLLPKRKDTTDVHRIRLSFVGRPNVGKSSLFNSLLAKQKAVVADVAGTTRDVNRHSVKYHGSSVELLDTAGIRRPGKIGKGIEHFSVLRALSAIEESDICCLVMDGTELNTHLDQKIAGMIKEAGKGLIIIVNKWDLVEKDAFTRDQIAKEISREFPYVSWAPLIFTSAETGQNVSKLFELSSEIKSVRDTEFTTKELNNWLADIKRHHPPAGLKNKHPNLTYVTQVGTNPPKLQIFGRDLKYLHWSYKRYMERELREMKDLTGTPVELVFTSNAGRKREGKDGY